MGEQNVKQDRDEAALRSFTRQLIQEVRAMEYMLREDLFETDVRRIGAEQELFLVDENWQPAPVNVAALEANTDERLVAELTRFNLEFNLHPLRFGGDCLSQMERQAEEMLAYTRKLVKEATGAEVIMSGILPTIHLSDMTLENMTPSPRYFALNDAIAALRDGPGQFQIRGVDELFVKHDTIMLEGCNTSFQTHFQVAPDEFARYYNIAQAVAGPCLAAATNSPLLFGKRLWQETRIALFQQAVDTRSSNLYLREMSPRVHFGTGWVEESVTELFKEDIARFRVLITAGEEEDPFDVLARGDVPKLKALQLHNGTVYRWNRACYGITDGKPHLRIENRILPAGPSLADEFANAAFWFGLVSGLAHSGVDVTEKMAFDEAKNNFVAAARLGLSSQLMWLEGARVPAHELICDQLIPLAREGLTASGIDQADVEHYLGIVEARVRARQTGAQWQLDSLAKMRGQGTRSERLSALVAATVARQKEGTPGHTWPPARIEDVTGPGRMQSTKVEQYMTTDLFTVHEDELVEFVACLMDWQRIRHVLVEDNKHRLVGLVSHRNLLRHLAEQGGRRGGLEQTSVKDIMVQNPVSVTPETKTMEAIRLMRERKIGSLPVVRDGQLVGIITERDFIHIASQILDASGKEEEAQPVP